MDIGVKIILVGILMYSAICMSKEITHNSIIKNSIGDISVYLKKQKAKNTPSIFLHGLFFDLQLWNHKMDAINDRDVIAIEMPLHGSSPDITTKNWNLGDCRKMICEILDSLQISKVHAVEHSRGSMTILRAAEKYPESFESLTPFNLPFNSCKWRAQNTAGVTVKSLEIIDNN
jgi:pimeloyl-ACP methyl ester carboxylesterase